MRCTPTKLASLAVGPGVWSPAIQLRITAPLVSSPLMQPPATEGMYYTATARTSSRAPRWARKTPISAVEPPAEDRAGAKEDARGETQAISGDLLCGGGDAGIRRVGERCRRQYRDQPGEGAGERRVSLHHKCGEHELSSHRQPHRPGQYQRNRCEYAQHHYRFERILDYRARHFQRPAIRNLCGGKRRYGGKRDDHRIRYGR